MRHKVFVYGSLMSGLGNHRLLMSEDTVAFGADKLMFPGVMLSLGAFPALKKYDTLAMIHGEVYEVSEDTFSSLDMLEGYPSFYNRELRLTKSYKRAWVYYLDEAYHTRDDLVVPSGDWRKYCSDRHPVPERYVSKGVNE